MNLSANTEVILNLGTIGAVIIFIATIIVKYTNFKDNVENKIQSIQKEIDTIKTEVAMVCMRQQNNEILLAEIRTKLAGIEQMLIQLQKDMKEQMLKK